MILNMILNALNKLNIKAVIMAATKHNETTVKKQTQH